MGLGGPVWHVSAAAQVRGVDRLELEDAAFCVLEGYGDESLGTWQEMPTGVFHLRRRLSAGEASLVGPVVDVRGTPEAARRAASVARWVRQAGPGAEEIAVREVEGR